LKKKVDSLYIKVLQNLILTNVNKKNLDLLLIMTNI